MIKIWIFDLTLILEYLSLPLSLSPPPSHRMLTFALKKLPNMEMSQYAVSMPVDIQVLNFCIAATVMDLYISEILLKDIVILMTLSSQSLVEQKAKRKLNPKQRNTTPFPETTLQTMQHCQVCPQAKTRRISGHSETKNTNVVLYQVFLREFRPVKMGTRVISVINT